MSDTRYDTPEPFKVDIPERALIDLDEGVRMVGEVVDVADDEIEIGMPLRVDFREIDDDLTLPVWRRAA